MNLYLKRSYDVECVPETQLVNDRKLAKLAKEGSHEQSRRRSIQDHVLLNRESSMSTTRQHLEAVRRKLVEPTTTNKRASMESASSVTIIHNAATKHEEDIKLSQWPDQDSDGRRSDVSNNNKENFECLSPQFQSSTASSAFSRSSEAPPLQESTTEAPPQQQPSWLANLKRKQALTKVATTSLLDQSTDSQPEDEQEQEAVNDDRISSSRESLMSTGRRTSLLDTVMEDERITALAPDTPSTLSGRKRSMGSTCSSSTVAADPSVAVPWANVKLRSRPAPVVDSNQSRQQHEETMSEASSALERHLGGATVGQSSTGSSASQATSNDDDSNVPPWMVKLRSRSKQQRDMEVANDTGSNVSQQSNSDLLSFRKQLRKVPSELNAVKRKEKESKLVEQGITKTPETKTLADLSWAPLSKQQANLKPRKSTVCGIVQGDDIDLSNLPEDAFGSANDVMIVDLDRIPGMPEEHKLSVVVGKNMILEARTVEGVQLSRVNWRVPRSDVKSLALDMADRRADIVLHGRKPKSLIFGSAEGCLRFANVFYETANKKSPNTSVEEQSSVVDDSESVADQGSVAPPASDGLTEEEQQLLEAFRQKRKTKSSAEAMREIQSDWTSYGTEKDSTGSAQSGLSSEEEKIAETYRKMLKVSIPPEAVRHRMTKDGVADKIVAAVLSEPSKELKASTASVSLSEEDEKVAETYRKMLKLQIPPEAVRHKMTKDQVNARIVDAVLGAGPSESKAEQPLQPSLSEEEEKLAASYRKMLKMMIPADAVRHKMKKDQASNNVVVAVFGPESDESKEAEQENKSALSEEEEEVAASYRKMLKMMIPAEAVRHKMKKDQVDVKIVAAVLGVDPNEEQQSKKNEASLTPADEKVAATYRKMIRMKVPPDGVRHKMEKNGVSEHIVEAVLGADITQPKAKKATTEAAKKPSVQGSKLVSLHWTPLSGEALDNSVWRASKKRKVGVAQPEGSDISKLVELFQKKTNKRVASATEASAGDGKGDDMAKLIDLNRANNLAISLKAFKDFSHEKLADTIAHLDPLQKITGERVQFMRDLLPTPTEAKVIKAYKGDERRLVPAELFFTKIVKVSRVQTKIQVMQAMDTLNDHASELGEKFVILETVCSQIMNSEKLEEVLDMVLHIGNIMNEGTRTGGAAGFKFDSLLRLTQTKSSDGKMTVLDYIVMIFVAKEKRETLQLLSDFPDCQVAGKMLITDMVNEVNNMNAALKKCEIELENLKKDNGETPPSVEESDPRAALLAALKKKAGGGVEETPKKPKNFGKRDAFLAAIEARKVPEPTELNGKPGKKKMVDDASPPEKEPFVAKDASLKSGIQRLEAFIADAKGVLKNLEDERDRAIDACKSLSRYCGESGGERATSTLIDILSQFATNLESAVKKHDERKLAEQRREAAAQKKKGQQQDTKAEVKPSFGKSLKKSSEPSTKGQSLVLMVNELLKEAPEDAKEDFKKGVVYVDPDDKLRAIYKKERESLGIFVPPDARKPSQVDLLIAIKKRRERADARRESMVSSAPEKEDDISTKGCNIGSCIS